MLNGYKVRKQDCARLYLLHLFYRPPQNGGSVNEVYATIALDALESADGLTTLDEAQAAVDTLVEASGLYSSRTPEEQSVALEAPVVAQATLEPVAEECEEAAPMEESFEDGARSGEAAAMDEAVARAAVALETAVEDVVEDAVEDVVEDVVDDVVEDAVETNVAVEEEVKVDGEASETEGTVVEDAVVVEDPPKAEEATSTFPAGLQLPAALAKVCYGPACACTRRQRRPARRLATWRWVWVQRRRWVRWPWTPPRWMQRSRRRSWRRSSSATTAGAPSKTRKQARSRWEDDGSFAGTRLHVCTGGGRRTTDTTSGRRSHTPHCAECHPGAAAGHRGVCCGRCGQSGDCVTPQARRGCPCSSQDGDQERRQGDDSACQGGPQGSGKAGAQRRTRARCCDAAPQLRQEGGQGLRGEGYRLLLHGYQQEEEEARNNVLMAWFRANPAKGGPDSKSARPVRVRMLCVGGRGVFVYTAHRPDRPSRPP